MILPHYEGGEEETVHYKTKTRAEKLVIDYAGISLWEVQELDLDVYLFLLREAFIHSLSKTKEGREYLENCWRMTQSKPDRKALRENVQKGA